MPARPDIKARVDLCGAGKENILAEAPGEQSHAGEVPDGREQSLRRAPGPFGGKDLHPERAGARARGSRLAHLSGSIPFQAGTLTCRWPRVPLMITFRTVTSFAVVVSCRWCPGLAVTWT